MSWNTLRQYPGKLIAIMLSLLVIQASSAMAQVSLEQALRQDSVQKGLQHIDSRRAAIAQSLVEIGGIISPSGQEHRRAQAVAERMRAMGLAQVRVDETPNAIGIIPGRSGKAVIFIATLDDLATVAAHQKEAGTMPRTDGDRVVGPGTNTSLVTAAMLAAAEALKQNDIMPEHDLVFAAVAQEETGLVGMKKVYEEYKDRAVGFVDILGDGRSISYGAIVIHWWKVIASGPGGHSLRGGLPNVNQAIGRSVDQILQLPHPKEHADERAVINISMLNSGAVYNHKPETGWFSLDIRSMDAAIVEDIEQNVAEILKQVASDTQIELKMEPFQLTPGGQIPGARESVLVTTAEAISKHLGFEEVRVSNMGSSNMNVAIGGGTPAIGLGGGRGGRRGYPDEWADIPVMLRTAKHVLLLAATLGGGK